MEEEKTPTLESLIDSVENYGKTSIDLAKLKAIRKVSEVVSSLAASVVVIFMTILCIFIFSIGLSLWIGDYLGKPYWGFFIIAGVYLLVAIICHAASKQLIKTPVSNSILKNILD